MNLDVPSDVSVCNTCKKANKQVHNAHTVSQIVTLRSSGERNGAQRRTKVSLGRTMMQALELLG